MASKLTAHADDTVTDAADGPLRKEITWIGLGDSVLDTVPLSRVLQLGREGQALKAAGCWETECIFAIA